MCVTVPNCAYPTWMRVLRLSSLYNPDLELPDWYNTSTGSPDLNANDFPYGFFHSHMEGYPDGYPVGVGGGASSTATWTDTR